jgi:hypothetical protein
VKEQELLGHLLDLARRLDYDVRTDQGPFRDGSCRLPSNADIPEDRRIILLNRNSPAHRKITALALALSERSLEGVFLLPAVRDAIEKASGASGVNPSTETNDSQSTLD